MESRSGQPRVFETNYAAGGRRLSSQVQSPDAGFCGYYLPGRIQKMNRRGSRRGEGGREANRKTEGWLVARERGRERVREREGREEWRARKKNGRLRRGGGRGSQKGRMVNCKRSFAVGACCTRPSRESSVEKGEKSILVLTSAPCQPDN